METEGKNDHGNGRIFSVPRWLFRASTGFFYVAVIGAFTAAILICFLLGSIAMQQQAIGVMQRVNAIQLRQAREDIERLEKKLGNAN